jgi:hypothetical protein
MIPYHLIYFLVLIHLNTLSRISVKGYIRYLKELKIIFRVLTAVVLVMRISLDVVLGSLELVY